MLKIYTNSKFFKEKKYTLNVIFKEFLAVNFQLIKKEEEKDVLIVFDTKSIIIKDCFFDFQKDNHYLKKSNIPESIPFYDFKFKSVNLKIPVIYGNNKITFNENGIVCYIDIIASTFFMLSRWEEYVIKERDDLDRFSAKNSLAFKNNFLQHPVVNYYIELVWNLLENINFTEKRKTRVFQLIPTHDVDLPRLWWKKKDLIKTLISSLIKQKSVKEFFSLLKVYLKKEDPFDTFDYLMSLSEKNNFKSHFFFMSGGTSNKDNFYKINNPLVIEIIKSIKNRNHNIGFHPSFNSYNNHSQFEKELRILEHVVGQKVGIGRQHFLRFEVPKTWQIWEDNKMKWDSSMTYHDIEGFRCGVCYPFSVFNILTRKQLKLVEKPLIVMDGSLVTYQTLTIEEAYNKIDFLIKQVKLFNGEFIFLWHNSAFNTKNWKPIQKVYEIILNENSNNNRSKTTIYKSSFT